MREAELTLGRRWVLVIEPGEEIVQTVAAWAARTGVGSATIDSFFGAFRSVRLIATHGEIADEEVPLPDAVDVPYTEGVGSGSIATVDGAPRVHLHIAAGVKGQAGAAYAGHLLAAETHYMAEVVVQEVLSPTFTVEPDPASYGLPVLTFVHP